jgi:Icc protein
MDRRKFLERTAKTVGALAIAASVKSWGDEAPAAEKPVHLALLSDTHVAADPKSENRKFLPWDNLKATVARVLEAAPDAVIHNGDVARTKGELEDYRAVETLLAPLAAQVPIYIGMGNHDSRENFFKVFDKASTAGQKIAGKHVLVIERPSVRFIMLDSLLYVNQVAGFLGLAQRDWLGKFLSESDDRATVLFVHHTLGDGDGELLDADRFFRVILPHKKVKAVIYGHSHAYNFSKREEIHLVNIPAVGYNFKDSEPVGWVDAQFTSKGAELTLKASGGNRSADGKTTSLNWST